jgi:[phosphatase 2A protein]-leucine-carboxy methyltransferase
MLTGDAGTYTRTTALDRLIDAFLSPSSSDGSTPSQRQIISLGAGTDTRPFRLFSHPSTPHLVYHEVDFDVISKRKFQTIQGNPSLSRILTEASPTEGQTWTSKPANGGEYYCHGVDLRELDKSIETPLTGLRPDVPTLVLSECCLCYLKHEEAARVVTYFTSRISNLSLIIYEPVHLDDAFGKTMVSNLAVRGIRMPGLDHCRNSDDQISRLRDAGFETAKCLTVDEIWEQWVEEGEKERIRGLERLDEVEEWKLLAGHYIVVWGYKGPGLGTMSDI